MKEQKHLVLKKAHVPVKICLKLAFKNIWKKKFRYLVMLFICSLSFTFLSFIIELNGEKLRENVYTMIENGYRFTEVYEHVELSKDEIKANVYNKYASQSLSNNSYNTLKKSVKDIVIHQYQPSNINYSNLEAEKANYFYTGNIKAIFKYDETNTYDLICGRLPEKDSKEILITDYLVEAFDYFDLYPEFNNIYDYLNIKINLKAENNYTVCGIIKTNYKKWDHLIPIQEVKTSDKEYYPFENELLFMNSVFLTEKYFEIERGSSLDSLVFSQSSSSKSYELMINNQLKTLNTKTIVLSNEQYPLEQVKTGYSGNTRITVYGHQPQNDDEIVVPYSWVTRYFNQNWVATTDKYYYYYDLMNYNNIWNIVKDKEIELTLRNNDDKIYLRKTYKIVGIHSGTKDDFDHITFTDNEFDTINRKFNNAEENILLELPNSSSDAYKIFNNALKAGYVINVWAYRGDIDNYVVDPFIELASKAGLFIFAAFTLGIIWTIISIEIVDSKKEIGILRSIGLGSFKVSLIFIIQAFTVIVLSYIISLIASYQIIPIYNSGITDIYDKITLYMYTFTYRTPLYVGIFAIIVTLISTLVPLLKIISKKIIDIINERDN